MEEYNVDSLGKWHHDIAIADGVRTSHLSAPYNGNAFVCKEKIANDIKNIYGDSLKDKKVLDVACNAGGHLFELNRFGIKSGFGFDIRSLWIKQASWVQRNIDIPCDNLLIAKGSFDVLQHFADRHFHLSLFNGIFYHLANPISELEKVANKTSELLIVNTAYDPDSNCSNPALICKNESSAMEHGLSGVEGLSWHPNGEQVLFKILAHLGFPHSKLSFKNPENRRLEVIASRVPDLI